MRGDCAKRKDRVPGTEGRGVEESPLLEDLCYDSGCICFGHAIRFRP